MTVTSVRISKTMTQSGFWDDKRGWILALSAAGACTLDESWGWVFHCAIPSLSSDWEDAGGLHSLSKDAGAFDLKSLSKDAGPKDLQQLISGAVAWSEDVGLRSSRDGHIDLVSLSEDVGPNDSQHLVPEAVSLSEDAGPNDSQHLVI